MSDPIDWTETDLAHGVTPGTNGTRGGVEAGDGTLARHTGDEVASDWEVVDSYLRGEDLSLTWRLCARQAFRRIMRASRRTPRGVVRDADEGALPPAAQRTLGEADRLVTAYRLALFAQLDDDPATAKRGRDNVRPAYEALIAALRAPALPVSGTGTPAPTGERAGGEARWCDDAAEILLRARQTALGTDEVKLTWVQSGNVLAALIPAPRPDVEADENPSTERFLTALSAFVAATAYRLAHSPHSEVTSEERDSFEAMRAALASMRAPDTPAAARAARPAREGGA